MKNYIVIRNGHGILAEGDTVEELEQAYERLNPEGGARLPRFSSIDFCHLEKEDGKLCILDTKENPSAADSYYNMGFER